MDNQTKKNEELWDQMSVQGVVCSRINFNMTQAQAQISIDKYNLLGKLKGKNVLCLASGGGQQSISYALLGANVTVTDFSAEQLSRDQLAAQKLGLEIKIVKTDMRDLSMFQAEEFDVVHQPYSINYIPAVDQLFTEVTRVLKPGGIYHLMFHNPFVHGSWKDGSWGSEWRKSDLWREKGYPIYLPYQDGYPISVDDPTWNFENKEGKKVKLEAPQEYKHTLSTIFNTLIDKNFSILKFIEYQNEDSNEAEVGTWDHYVSVTAPWLFLWVKKRKKLFRN